MLNTLPSTPQWDVVIIGGGATGLGCALDAASRGLKTLLLEKYDFAKGTSSRATKLVHGGVRYLQQGNVRLVMEALHERGRLLKQAPHICHTLPFVLPFYRWWEKWYYGFGLTIYEWLSGKYSLGKTSVISKRKLDEYLPALKKDKIYGGILYYDGQFDDSRLAICLAQSAARAGAVLLNYCAVTGFTKTNGKITGVHAYDTESEIECSINATVVINATGVFADELLQLTEEGHMPTITPSQGIHIVIDKHFFEGNHALMIPKTDDDRVLFAIPWYDKVLVGTTDTAVSHIDAEPRALEDEIAFVISHFNRYAKQPIQRSDVKTIFAGLRPLAKSTGGKTAVMPRDHKITVLPSGLVHITGGKWTTYRSMAEHAIDAAIKAAGWPARDCQTRKQQLHGYTQQPEKGHWGMYGSEAAAIRQLMQDNESLQQLIHPQYPFTAAEVVWATRFEMAITVEDMLARRIRLLFIDAAAALATAPAVARIMAGEMNKDELWIAGQLQSFETLAKGYMVVA
jgi:glycerol-3-phosphate dehydrogenase